ncbi:hypothetical protein LTR37_009484 [Vermiconidia calcicola]|uniref:Uncharacterized protein n=1 Tax=Vermiconidia calcicola TaxID=1690605 RepID=A0ACC3N838_9PEZI|nr:hypothetical protein LTR37_009484 [Vermiconidia calcicola]
MADTAPNHAYTLNPIDQTFSRAYIRHAFCYPYTDKDTAPIHNHFIGKLKRTVTQLPILAGNVRPVRTEHGGDGQQRGCVEVAVTLAKVLSFSPTVRSLDKDEFPYTYEELVETGMSAGAFINENLSALPDLAEAQDSPVFGVQLNYIRGGVIVAFSLHHSVGDLTSLRTIFSHVCSDLPSRKLTDIDLEDDAKDQSRQRDRLSGSRGIKADLVLSSLPTPNEPTVAEAHRISEGTDVQSVGNVLFFHLKIIQGIQTIVNERFDNIQNNRLARVSKFDVLAAILWKGINRARRGCDAEFDHEGRISTLVVPVNIRSKMQPPLDDTYFGNAVIRALATENIMKLAMPYDPATVATAALQIRRSIVDVGEDRVRSTIASINKSENVQKTPVTELNLDTDLVITSWAGLMLEESDLGIGLGKAEYGRKFTRKDTNLGCIVYSPRQQEGLWEVNVQLEKRTMDRLLEDEHFMQHVVKVA